MPPGPRSALLNIALPADVVSSLGANPKPGVESWDFTGSYDDAVRLLTSELPLGQPYKGLPYCVNHASDAMKRQVTDFKWSDGTRAVQVSVTRGGGVFSVKDASTISSATDPTTSNLISVAASSAQLVSRAGAFPIERCVFQCSLPESHGACLRFARPDWSR